MAVLVAGGAGYIGSHTVVELLDRGYDVIVFDNLETGCLDLVDSRAVFYKGDLRNKEDLRTPFKKNRIDAVINLAAYIKVGESVENPNKYYENNICGIINLTEVMKEFRVDSLVFSSTAAVYGDVAKQYVDEECSTYPINPYGMSKFMSERIIADASSAYGIKYVIFRYFNVAGVHEKYPLWNRREKKESLIPIILDVAKGNRDSVDIFGNNYLTKDGTGVRDFIHVVDVARAHVLAVEKLKEGKCGVFNLGNGKGFSVLEVLESARSVTGRDIPALVSKRRFGDPSCVVASSEKAKRELGWEPVYKDIDEMIRTQWIWDKDR